MMSSETSSSPQVTGKDAGMQPWHLFLLLSMVGATWAVVEARHTHPAALLLLSAAVISAGLVAMASHRALSGFLGQQTAMPLTASERQGLEEEKALILRAIKELEFDFSMRKMDQADYQDLSTRLRARAVDVMDRLDRAEKAEASLRVQAAPAATDVHACRSCHTPNDPDAKFCKSCGAKL